MGCTTVSDAECVGDSSDSFGFKAQQRVLLAMKSISKWMVVVMLINIALAVVQAELRWQLRQRGAGVDDMSNVIKGVNSIFIIIMLILLVLLYRYELQYMVLRCSLPSGVSLLNSGLVRRFLLEFVILALHPPPWPSTAASATSDVRPLVGFQGEAILTSAVFLRVYLLGRWIFRRSRLFSPSGRFIEALTKSEFDTALVAKMTIHRHPIRSVAIIFALILSTGSYTVWCLERWAALRQIQIDPDGTAFQTVIGKELIWYGNCLWLTMVTVFTIGYGDLYPVTPAGRVVVLVAGFLGNMCTCLLIAVLTGLIKLDPVEERVAHFLDRDRFRRKVKECAVTCVQTAYRRWRKTTLRAKRAGSLGAAAAAARREEELRKPLSGKEHASEGERERRLKAYDEERGCQGAVADAVETGCGDALRGAPPKRPPTDLDYKLHRTLIRWRKLKRYGVRLAQDELEEKRGHEAELAALQRSLEAVLSRLDTLSAKVDALAALDPAVASHLAAASAGAQTGRRRSMVRRRSSVAEGTPSLVGIIAGVSRSPSPGPVPTRRPGSTSRGALSPSHSLPVGGAGRRTTLAPDDEEHLGPSQSAPAAPAPVTLQVSPPAEGQAGSATSPPPPSRAASVGGPGRPLQH
eukprot:tig00001093_g6896.t1